MGGEEGGGREEGRGEEKSGRLVNIKKKWKALFFFPPPCPIIYSYLPSPTKFSGA